MRIETITLLPAAPVASAARAAEAHEGRSAQAAPPRRAEQPGRGEPENIEATLGKLGEELKSFDIALRFRRDEESGAIVIDLFDQATGEKVRQIPTEASLHLSMVLGRLKGVVVDLQA